MSKSKILTKKIAERFLKNVSLEHGIVDLSGFNSMEDAAAVCLVSRPGLTIYMPDLKRLSDAAAQIFSTHDGHLAFESLDCISSQAARWLARKKCGGLYLQSLSNIADDEAAAFGSFTGEALKLGLKSLSVPVAAALARKKKWLSLDRLENLSDGAAAALSRLHPNVWLSLNGLTGLSEASAASLGRRGGWLSLNGLTNLSLDAATSLSKLKMLQINSDTRKWINKAKKASRAAGKKKSRHASTPAGCPESVFEWMIGGVLAVNAQDEAVESFADSMDLDYQVVANVNTRNWCLLNGVGLFVQIPDGKYENIGECMSDKLRKRVVHLWYEDASGLVGYTVYDSGKEVESYVDHGSDPDLEETGKKFESKLTSGTPDDLKRMESNEDGIDCRFIDKRFKELGLGMPKRME